MQAFIHILNLFELGLVRVIQMILVTMQEKDKYRKLCDLGHEDDYDGNIPL